MLSCLPFLTRLFYWKKCWLLKLPFELQSIIFSYLSLPSQACFALTCKPLLATFGSVLQHQELAFPHIYRRYDTGAKIVDSTLRARTDFLLRLHGSRWGGKSWEYCGQCLKLHPSNQVMHYVTKEPKQSHCIYSGTVVLCPCVHLNARGKIRLINQLQKGSILQNWHNCDHFLDPGNVKLKVSISLSLTELGELVVRTRYVLRFCLIDSSQLGYIGCCPHEYHYNGSRYLSTDCPSCETEIQFFPPTGFSQSVIEVTRYLGGAEHPAGMTWRNQCELKYEGIHK